MSDCTRKACCSDNPGAETSAACFSIAACGCKVVRHINHPTTADFFAYLKSTPTTTAPECAERKS